MAKVNCLGDLLCANTYHPSSTIDNTSYRLLETPDGGYFMTTNIGSYQQYDMLIIRTDSTGDVLWQKIMNGVRDDHIKDVTLTQDGGFLLVGKTGSYGTDTGGPAAFTDVYVVKLNSEGGMEWAKTIGNNQAIDGARAVVATSDGGYAITGRFIERGAFHALLLKMNAVGDVEFIKTFGDSLHRVYSYDIIETDDNGLLLTGSSTLNKDNHQSYSDVFLIKTDAFGDTLWTRSYTGSDPDRGDIGSSVIKTHDGGYAIAVATLSYPTTGFVPNKHVIIKTDSEGHMEFAKSYISGGAHYPEIASFRYNSDIILAGYSNNYSPYFSPTIFRLDSLLQSGCNEVDLSGKTYEQQPPFVVTTPNYTELGGGTWLSSLIREPFTLTAKTLCENIMQEECDPIVITSDYTPSDITAEVDIYPNPADRQIVLEWEQTTSGELFIEIWNQNGQILHQQELSVSSGEQRQSLLIQSYPPGLYTVRIWGDGKERIKRFVKR